jgi:Fur family peroxide stress response transcriptional regulator
MHKKDLGSLEIVFRENGLPLTVQRKVILEAILERTDHPTADQIYETVKDDLPGLSKATVYRVLDTLVQVGVVQKVFHTDAVARFDPMVSRHHHAICRRCGQLIDLEPEIVPDIPLPNIEPSGFEVTDYSINFTGVCLRCQT